MRSPISQALPADVLQSAVSSDHCTLQEEREDESLNFKQDAQATIDYYNCNAEAFAASTANVEFSDMQEKLASLLAPGASVLDFGCGSGRDAKSFLKQGFRVAATDGSPEMCRIASRLTGLEVRNELFGDLADVAAYDGIWACSSILHLPKAELADVFPKMLAALRPGGVIYASFKYGTFEGWRNGRYFTDFTEASFRDFADAVGGFEAAEQWVSGDVRPGRGDEKWLNLLLAKS
ncbi:MAG: class I SAM-dependent methyltransferase [Eggerthellaceae bacterium]|nr:class I SAM-dependent methyltransferase [Eggerthellaceae bacterium]